MLNFTRQERVVVYFLVITLGAGAILKLIRDNRFREDVKATRFYEEEQQFAEISEQINSSTFEYIDSTGTSDIETGESMSGDSPTGDLSFNKIDINTAGLDELTKLPGIGPVTAKRIRAYVEVNGPFTAIEEIVLVKGIGKKMYAKIQDLVTIE